MLAEIIEDAYDVHGRLLAQSPAGRRRRVFHPTYPIKRFLTQPLQEHCASLEDVRQFLCGCEYISDREQFQRGDYWMPPEEFERVRQGDCEDHALWAWRQLLALDVPCRFVVGRSGRYGQGHAWLTVQKDGRHFLMECQRPFLTSRLPRLSTVRYKPEISVQLDGEHVKYFEHEQKAYDPALGEAFALAVEWFTFWIGLSGKVVLKLLLLPCRVLWRIVRRRSAHQSASHGPGTAGAEPGQ